MQDLTEVLDEAPAHSDATFNEGLLLLSGGQLAEARAAFEGIQDPVRRADAALPSHMRASHLATGRPQLGYCGEPCHLSVQDGRRFTELSFCLRRKPRSAMRTRWGPPLRLPWNDTLTTRGSSYWRRYALTSLAVPKAPRTRSSMPSGTLTIPTAERSWCGLAPSTKVWGASRKAADRLAEVVGDVPWHPRRFPSSCAWQTAIGSARHSVAREESARGILSHPEW